MDISLPEILNNVYYGNRLAEYIASFLVFLAVYISLKLIRWISVRKLAKLTRNTKVKADDVIINIIKSFRWPALLIISLNAGLFLIEVPEDTSSIISKVSVIVLSYYVVKAAQQVTNYVINSIKEQIKAKDESADTSVMDVIRKILNVLFWILAIIIILENFGFDLSTLVAGVGVGSIAIAFALQNVLEDLFASISIYFDRPFNPGDFIVVGDKMGTVKTIGIQTTRLKSLSGEEIVLSNRQLNDAEIQNYKKMSERRIEFTFGVTYETPLEKIREIPEIVAKIIEPIDIAVHNRTHFKNLGEYSLDFEVVYIIESSSYETYMDIQQKINLELMEEFEKQKIEFAYPTKVILNKNI